ncbi:TetR/AcrR family transcriptional regulator [Desemzia sp. RIT804]|uniref:TetR/AcrR family transcriptional regulator n=1 Tax=Desemzia sp. RIT 804 TaxID=2810209 RepID=UPI00195016A3|nr:TetR/AcrR family transcriptional regulator [Desemzia sp. RIT 804]MBM6614298.1 TetR/AcrR family transcriptional regulator [Desemzia sp. RIT 804]
MARKKTIMKSSILDTAYEVVKAEGFDGFTARNIAKEMNCSTQPIYLEFKNMDDLKRELLVRIKAHLTETIYAQERMEKPILNDALNYLHFAKEEPVFFKALYLENRLDAKQIYAISHDVVLDSFEKEDETKGLQKSEKEKLFALLWASVHGAASLIAQDLIPFNEEELTKYLKQSLKGCLKVI